MKSKSLYTLVILSVFLGITSNLLACTYPPTPFIDYARTSDGVIVHMDSNGDYYVAVGETVTFDCSVIYDTEHGCGLMEYEFDYETDGTVDDTGDEFSGGTFSETHSFGTIGTYTVTVTVTDWDNVEGTDSVVVHVGPARVHNEIKDIWYSYIQHAIDGADTGNIIRANKGTYEENINFRALDITITSESPDNPAVVADTVILGDGINPVVTFNGKEGTTSGQECNLIGFTITSDPDYGLAAHWKLDGNTNDELGLNPGTLHSGGTPSWPDGAVGKAFDHDNNQYVSALMVIDPAEGLFSAFTWVKRGGTSQQQTILSQSGTGGCDWLYLNSSDQLCTGLIPSGGSALVAVSSDFSDDNWHFVGVVWDGSKRHLYIDGVEKAVDSSAISNFSSCTGGMRIGANADVTASEFWDGQIDDVRIYSRQVLPLRFPFGGKRLTKKVAALVYGSVIIDDDSEFLYFANTPNDWNKYVELTDDIDLSGNPFTKAVIAWDTDSSTSGHQGAFTGFFEGNGYEITDMTVSGSDYLGLFGYIVGGVVQNLGVVDGDVSGNNSAGSLAGYVDNAIIENCYTTGNDISGSVDIGGLIGDVFSTNINNCYSIDGVTGLSVVGGLVGYSEDATIYNSYADSWVQGSYFCLGGLVGWSDYGNIENCYALGYVNGWADYVGGLVGYADYIDIVECYATASLYSQSCVGGLIGNAYSANIYNCHAESWPTANSEVGGLVGVSSSTTIHNCYTTGEVDSFMCYNAGGLIGSSSNSVFYGTSFWGTNLYVSAGIGNMTAPLEVVEIDLASATVASFTGAGWDFVGETNNGTEDIWEFKTGVGPVFVSGSGGICGNGSLPTVSKCIITGNKSENGGGIDDCDGEISNCTITSNTATAKGGGLADCDGVILNCLVAGNSSVYGGGFEDCDGYIINCTVVDNAAAMTGGGLNNCNGSGKNIANNIIWGNTGDQIAGYAGATVEDNCIQGGLGSANISGDPQFIDADGMDNNAETINDNDYHINMGSPCIDAAGDFGVTADIEGIGRPVDIMHVDNNGEISDFDIGAYEFYNVFPELLVSYLKLDEDGDGVEDIVDDYPFDNTKDTWPVVLESAEDGSDSQQTIPNAYPFNITGTFSKDKDEDNFSFTSTKGEVITILVEYSGPVNDFDFSILSLNQIGNVLSLKSDWNRNPYVSAISLLVVKDQIDFVVRGDDLKGNVDLPYSIKIFKDKDMDGVDDDKEQAIGMDKHKVDTDGDQVPDIVELIAGNADIDGDTLPNWLDYDSDGDGILDYVEGYKDIDSDELGCFADNDSDNNGTLDRDEPAPIDLDTDSDGIYDYADTDDDGDGILDGNDDAPLISAPRSNALIYDEGTGVYSENPDYVGILKLVVDFGDSKEITDIAKTGDTLIINGSGFGVAGENLVIFTSEYGPINVVPTILESGVKLSAVVPDNVTKPVMVSVAKSIAGSYVRSGIVELSILNSDAPVLYEPDPDGTVNPPMGDIGQTVTFYGVGLDNVEKVNFNGVEASVSNVTSTQFVVLIPNNANSGDLTAIDQLGRSSNTILFLTMKTPVKTVVELPTGFPQTPAVAYPKLTAIYGLADEASVNVDGIANIKINSSSVDTIHVFYEEVPGEVPYNAVSFLQAIILPGDENVRITTESTAVSHVFELLQSAIEEDQIEDVIQIIRDIPEVQVLADTIKDGLNCHPYFMSNPDPGNSCQQVCYQAFQDALRLALNAADTAIIDSQAQRPMMMKTMASNSNEPYITPEQQDVSVFAHYEKGKNIGVENDTKLYLSATIIDSQTEQVLQEHIGSYYDKNLVGPHKGLYSFFNAKRKSFKQPKGKDCRVEVLTGGLNQAIALTPYEREIQSNLRFKSLIGGVLLPTFQFAIGKAAKKLDVSFVEQCILSYNPKLVKIVCEMIDTGDEIGAAKKLVNEVVKEFNPVKPGKIAKAIVKKCYKEKIDAALEKIAIRLGVKFIPVLGDVLKVLDGIKLGDKAYGAFDCLKDFAITDNMLIFNVQWQPGVIYSISPNHIRDDGRDKNVKIWGEGLRRVGDDWPEVKLTDESGNSITISPWKLEGGDDLDITIPYSFFAGKTGPITVQVLIGELYTIDAPDGEDITISNEVVIESLDTSFGGPGKIIKIIGSGFSDILAENIVTFEGTSGRVTANPIDVISTVYCLFVNVPEDVTTGYVQVSVGDDHSNTDKIFAAEPYLSSIYPAQGRSGDLITFNGNGFTNGNIEYIYFNENSGSMTSFVISEVQILSDLQLQLRLPPDMIPGQYTIYFKMQDFDDIIQETFVVSAAEITEILPDEEWENGYIEIYGIGFDNNNVNNNVVTFCGSSGPMDVIPEIVTSAMLSVQVPVGAITGPVFVTVDGAASNSLDFNVKGIQLTGYTRSGDPSFIILSGQDFSIFPDDNVVYFKTDGGGEIEAYPLNASYQGDWLTAVIPPEAVDGDMYVMSIYNGITMNSNVIPFMRVEIDSLNPDSADRGDTIRINGEGFSAYAPDNTVTFSDGLEGTISVVDPDGGWIDVVVPNEARSGPVKVTVDVSGNSFTSNEVHFTNETLAIYYLSDNAHKGGVLVIVGDGFSDVPEDNVVTFPDGLEVQATSVLIDMDDEELGPWIGLDSLSVIIPQTAISGDVQVSVSGSISNGLPISFGPAINKIVPDIGHPGVPAWEMLGSEIVICGFNFSPNLGENTVSIGGHTALNKEINIDEDGWCQLHVYVPDSLDLGQFDPDLEPDQLYDVIVDVAGGESATKCNSFTMRSWYYLIINLWDSNLMFGTVDDEFTLSVWDGLFEETTDLYNTNNEFTSSEYGFRYDDVFYADVILESTLYDDGTLGFSIEPWILEISEDWGYTWSPVEEGYFTRTTTVTYDNPYYIDVVGGRTFRSSDDISPVILSPSPSPSFLPVSTQIAEIHDVPAQSTIVNVNDLITVDETKIQKPEIVELELPTDIETHKAIVKATLHNKIALEKSSTADSIKLAEALILQELGPREIKYKPYVLPVSSKQRPNE